MNQNYQLIAFDLDGTLLDDQMCLPQVTINGLNRFLQSGIKGVVISGRCLADVQKIVGDLPFSYLAGLNGAQIYNYQRKILEKVYPMDKEDQQKLVCFLKQYNQCMLFFTDQPIYIYNEPEDVLLKLYTDSLNPFIIPPQSLVENWPSDQLISIQIAADHSSKQQIRKNFERYHFQKLDIVDAGYHFLIIQKKNIDKGKCLAYICQTLNIDLKNTIAIGDSENDLSMLKTAGLGIGMKNSTEEILKNIDHFTDKDNRSNGAVDYLAKILNKTFHDN
ncbi:MAG: Cof-type HAD-IIB family hydrolase [Spirochaetes bacterium]|nr:Cof-type HAD-IIB family hydrolase [Spirochaetota bacterium]